MTTPPPTEPPAAAAPLLDDLRARLYDAALGELSADEIKALEAEIAAHPDRAALTADRARLEQSLQLTAANPALQALQPSEPWRVQTLHKAKVEAARLRKTRVSKAMPVARPPVTHRQLAGLTTQSVTAHADLPLSADGLPGFGSTGPSRFAPPPNVRRYFWVVLMLGLIGVVVMFFIALRVMQHWQLPSDLDNAGGEVPLPGDRPTPGMTPRPPLNATEKPLTGLELLTLKTRFSDLTRVRHAGAAAITFERGGTLTPATWPWVEKASSPGGAHLDPDHERYCGPATPRGWDALELAGDLATVEWVYVPDDPKGILLIVRPKPLPPPPRPDGPSAEPVPAATPGWELEVRKNLTQMVVFDIPPPPLSPAGAGGAGLERRSLVIERIPLANDEEELRFKVRLPKVLGSAPPVPPVPPVPPGPPVPLVPLVPPVSPAAPVPTGPTGPTGPIGPATAATEATTAATDADVETWTVLSERILPQKTGPGHWCIEQPKGVPLPALTYTLTQSIPRQSVQP